MGSDTVTMTPKTQKRAVGERSHFVVEIFEVVRLASLVDTVGVVADVKWGLLDIVELGDNLAPHFLRHRRPDCLDDLSTFRLSSAKSGSPARESIRA